jgi:multiple sugar transport system substrate-binding protein
MFRRALIGLCGILTAGRSVAATELTILWAEWEPANYLQELVNQYEDLTGIKVTIETVNWPDFQTKAFVEFIAKGDAYDMVVGDSQWLGTAATQGHYIELTDFVDKHRLKEKMAPPTMTYLSEYPKGSGRYWAVPLEVDAIGWAYRKDWFDDSNEKRAFRKKYGYELAVPNTWKELTDIAEFFHRPEDVPSRYGIAIYMDLRGDAMAMGYTTALYSYGGELGDYATCDVEGIINSPRAVQALEAYRRLSRFTPPNWASAIWHENNMAIINGMAAMSMNYFAFLPSLVNPSINPHAAETGFFANPAGPTGDRYSALGGQGISIVTYSGKREESMKFLDWLVREDTQQKWADLGGYTAQAAILESPKFRNATPYNEAFFQSMFVVKDFWALPYYATLLDQMKKRIGPYVHYGEGTAKQALEGLAADWKATIAEQGCK